MRRLIVGFVLGLLCAFSIPTSEAVRLSKPPTITDWTPSSIAQLNTWLEALWQLTNGRVTTDVTTTNPDGSRVGTQGDTVLYNNGGSWKECHNTSTTTAASPTGTAWRCDDTALTTP